MDREQLLRHPIIVAAVGAVIGAVVGSTATVVLTHWFDRNKPPTLISVVPSSAQDEHSRLVTMKAVVDKMWNEANYGESEDLKKNAITFRDGFPSDAVGFDRRDNLELIFGSLQDQLSVYISTCADRKPQRTVKPQPDYPGITCNELTHEILEPELEAFSRALQKRIQQLE